MEPNKNRPSLLWRAKFGSQSDDFLRSLFLDNLAYKMVSLFVALVLWLAILGRRDFVASQDVEIFFTPSKGKTVISQSSDRVRLKLSGPQNSIKRYKARLNSIMIDVTHLNDGVHDVDIGNQNFDLPSGIRALSIKPNVVRVELGSR